MNINKFLSSIENICLDLKFKIEIFLEKKIKKTDYSWKDISKKIQKKWVYEFYKPINVVLGNEWSPGNLSYHLKSRLIWEGTIEKSKLNNYRLFLCVYDIYVCNKWIFIYVLVLLIKWKN